MQDKGQVAVMTFNPEQKVTAWTQWVTKGLFESVQTARPNLSVGVSDAAYFVVQRIINGKIVRYIERTDNRQFANVRDCFFVDSGLTYDQPVSITAIDLDTNTTITAADHGLSVDDEVVFSDIQWEEIYDRYFNSSQPDQLNDIIFKVKSVSGNDFVIKDFSVGGDVNSEGFKSYIKGGKVRKMVKTIRGLSHLEGEEILALADGNVIEGLVVKNGAITLLHRYGRIHFGLRYISEIETLDIESQTATIQGVFKSFSEVIIRFHNSRGLLIAPGGSTSFEELSQRTTEPLGDPIRLKTGDVTIPLVNEWDTGGRLKIRQKDPLPLGILAVIPVFDIEDQQ